MLRSQVCDQTAGLSYVGSDEAKQIGVFRAFDVELDRWKDQPLGEQLPVMRSQRSRGRPADIHVMGGRSRPADQPILCEHRRYQIEVRRVHTSHVGMVEKERVSGPDCLGPTILGKTSLHRQRHGSELGGDTLILGYGLACRGKDRAAEVLHFADDWAVAGAFQDACHLSCAVEQRTVDQFERDRIQPTCAFSHCLPPRSKGSRIHRLLRSGPRESPWSSRVVRRLRARPDAIRRRECHGHTPGRTPALASRAV